MRRFAQRNPQLPQPKLTMKQVTELIDEKLNIEHQSTNIGKVGADYIETVSNPFGSERQGPKSLNVGYPDGHKNVINLTMVWNQTFLGSTSATGMIVADMPHSTMSAGANSPPVYIVYGNDPLDKTASPTTCAYAAVSADAAMASNLLAMDGAAIRPTQVGIRVRATSDALSTAGVLQHVLGRSSFLTSAVPAFATYGTGVDSVSPDAFEATDGITVRCPVEDTWVNFYSPRAVNFNAWNGGCLMPRVYFNIGVDTAIQVTVVYHFQLLVPNDALCLPAINDEPEEEIKKIVYLVNSFPFASKGNSFKSFLESVKKVGGKTLSFLEKAAKFIQKWSPVVAPLLKAVA
jgi:hypothetical protein